MTGVFEGFAAIGFVIAVGALLAHLRVVDAGSQLLLSRIAFYVASPALMVTILSETPVAQVISGNLVASAAGVAATVTVYAVLARLVWHRDLADGTIGALASAYVNAGNLGIPIAAYVLGDASLVAPTLLMQMLVLQPLALTILDRATRESRVSLGRSLVAPLLNPLTLASLLGVALSLTGLRIPELVHAPLELIGGMAVPSMLLAYGVSLRLGPKFGSGAGSEVAVASVLKIVVQPLVAWVVAHWVLGLDGAALLAIVVTSALPTAQNIFTHAVRYDRGTTLARDVILVTTVGSVPVILLITLLLG